MLSGIYSCRGCRIDHLNGSHVWSAISLAFFKCILLSYFRSSIFRPEWYPLLVTLCIRVSYQKLIKKLQCTLVSCGELNISLLARILSAVVATALRYVAGDPTSSWPSLRYAALAAFAALLSLSSRMKLTSHSAPFSLLVRYSGVE